MPSPGKRSRYRGHVVHVHLDSGVLMADAVSRVDPGWSWVFGIMIDRWSNKYTLTSPITINHMPPSILTTGLSSLEHALD